MVLASVCLQQQLRLPAKVVTVATVDERFTFRLTWTVHKLCPGQARGGQGGGGGTLKALGFDLRTKRPETRKWD